MDAAARRQQLLEAAARCFAEFGYRGTTTASLAQAAGVSEPLLYRHFANKRELFIALVQSVGEEVIDVWQQAITPIHSPLERLRVLLYHNPATRASRTEQIYRIIFHASTEFSEREIQEAIRHHYEQYVAFLSKIVSDAQAAGQVRADCTASELAWQILHAAVGFAMIKPAQIPGHEDPESVGRTIELLMEMLTRGTDYA
jgi:AcrR family transcriptional regulator